MLETEDESSVKRLSLDSSLGCCSISDSVSYGRVFCTGGTSDVFVDGSLEPGRTFHAWLLEF